MKILWVSNSPVGPSANILGSEYSGTSGGWIQSEFDKIEKENNEFFFLCSSRQVKKKEVIKKTNELGTVFCVHSPRLCYGIKNPKYLINEINSIISQIDPDVINIWGTETCISNIVANVKTNCKKYVFIQGLLGVHSRYLGGYFNKNTNRFFVKPGLKDAIKEYIRESGFRKQAAIEKDTVNKCKNIICDSEFVKSYCRSICSDAVFYDYELAPNKVFYQAKWNSEKCEAHSVFTIYSGSPEKGLQQLIMALGTVKKTYPDVKLYVPGIYPVKGSSLLPDGFYNKNLCALIEHFDLKENVVFLGKLSPQQMAERMEKVQCFVNPSIMEVHALSLREAMTVGVPCVTSNCGSVVEFFKHGVDGYIYRYEEYEMLAHYIMAIFDDSKNSASDKDGRCAENLTELYRS